MRYFCLIFLSPGISDTGHGRRFSMVSCHCEAKTTQHHRPACVFVARMAHPDAFRCCLPHHRRINIRFSTGPMRRNRGSLAKWSYRMECVCLKRVVRCHLHCYPGDTALFRGRKSITTEGRAGNGSTRRIFALSLYGTQPFVNYPPPSFLQSSRVRSAARVKSSGRQWHDYSAERNSLRIAVYRM